MEEVAAAMGSEGELSSGYKLVPWSSWDQWRFVRRSIFSSSPDDVAAAFSRISAWRSRGCLPVPIDVTAAFVEIQQKDPYFRKEAVDGALESDELLAMLYSMAIIRLVNCFVEPAHKKTGRSISELADAVGIPRVLVDIRHESSHRDLPSLRLVRFASIKALDWLKHNYWDTQVNAIPDVRKEIRYRLREVTYYIGTKDGQKASSDAKGKRAKRTALLMAHSKLSSQITAKLRSTKSTAYEKHISKTMKIIARLYSSYPLEVVSVLLEFFQLQGPDFSGSIHMENSNNTHVADLGSLSGSMYVLKTIITRLSSKRPQLLLSILKHVVETIEADESLDIKDGEYNSLSSQNQARISHVRHLCSLVYWLIMNLKALRESGKILVIEKTVVFSMDDSCVPKVSLVKLLHKCLALSVLGNKHLLDSIVLLTDMMENRSLKEKLKKLPLLRSQDWDPMEDSAYTNVESMLLQEEDSVKKAAQKLEILKLRLYSLHNKSTNQMVGEADTTNIWTMAKSWIPCPIGMLPCSFSSTAVLPVLDQFNDELKAKIRTDKEKANLDCAIDDTHLDSHLQLSKDGTAIKKLKSSPGEERLDFPKTSPVQGLLLIDGIWKKVSEEELLAIQSDIRIFA